MEIISKLCYSEIMGVSRSRNPMVPDFLCVFLFDPYWIFIFYLPVDSTHQQTLITGYPSIGILSAL